LFHIQEKVMITHFGKELRKLRLDLGITLFAMAEKAGVSSSLLSSAETGKKPATQALVDKLADAFPEVNARKSEFLNFAAETAGEVRIRLISDRQKANATALAFARNFESFSDSQLDSLMSIFKKGAD
jgi:HTH-type transcriptional regulator, competence development regulator